MSDYQQIIESCGAEFIRQTGDGTVYFRNGDGVQLRIYDVACTPENVKLRLDMTKKFPATRRDDLGETIRILRSQIANLQHELSCARRDGVEHNFSADVTPERAEIRRARAALHAVEVLNQLDDLRPDLKSRVQEWEMCPLSFREIHEVELEIAETQRDLKYFEAIVADLKKQLHSLQLTSVSVGAIG
jgi:hypothetical protein